MPSITCCIVIWLVDCSFDQLLKAADRGVRVRLLVDDMDMAGRDLGSCST